MRALSVRLIAVSLLSTAAPAAAQQPLNLEVRDGLVTLHAENVSLPQILAEWSRVTGTRIVNAERVGGAPVSLDLTAVPEQRAIEILLRNVAGYVLGARADGSTAASSIDRIVILPTSAPPRPAPQGPFTNAPAARVVQPGFPRQVLPQQPEPSVDPDDVEETLPDDGEIPRSQLVRPGAPRPAPPRFSNTPDTDTPAPGGDAPNGRMIVTPTNPFGVPAGSSATPGVVTPVPQPPQNQRPRIQEPD